MAVAELISVEQYLKSVYRPDCDYVDGVIEERNLGERDHSWIQRNLVGFFFTKFHETGITALPEWRFQVRPTRFRIPDVVVTRGKPEEQILTRAPLLCIEILSPEDTVSRTNTRVQEYLDVGTLVVWVIDPIEKIVWLYRKTGMEKVTEGAIRVDGTELDVPFSAIFD